MPSPGPAFRLAFVYVAIFGWIGAYLPYWPVWLAEHGMSSTQIGILLGVAPWTRVIANPIAGRWAERSGRPDRLVRRLSVGLVLSLTGFLWLDGFTGLLLGMVAVGIVFAPINPLADGMTVGEEAEGRLRYGPVRLWGSLAFILVSWLGGELLERQGESVVLWMLIGLAAVLVLACFLLHRPTPSADAPPSDTPTPPLDSQPSTPAPAPRSRAFMVMLIIAALLHASHAVLYALGTQHWRHAGIDEGTVGLLWAEGVLAEVIIFAYGSTVGRWLSPRSLWLLAGMAGVVRWSLLASTVAIPWLIAGQVLHALTFGALHLGVMAFIRRQVAPAARGRASTTYSAVATGLALGIALPLAGTFYEHLAGQAYWIMAGLSAAALVLAAGYRDLSVSTTSAGDDVAA